ncbi:ABC transporter permease DevC [Dulcicalothrix desertica]|uniref:ABC transporter permease DevC n=1 Tax=Dulcicalothrix desertica TaxID=32056 RepID=UPI001198E1B0|nr:ABC transporter permease DevC [Dulcicalothrix desertica]TWH43880.1 putative ABC transport system permease protein [Dulcicalothrix desertica PCC 7102]
MFRKLLRKTPLAWFQVRREKTRLAVALAGIAFADVLMFVQMGLNETLYESAANLHYSLQADLFIINPVSEAFTSLKSFPRERLYQARAFKEVQSVTPLYIGRATWRNPQQTQTERTIFTVGVSPTKSVFDQPEITQQFNKLKMLDRVIFDRASRAEFGDIATLLKKDSSLSVQVNDKQIQVVGLFTFGISFGSDGMMIASDSTFMRIFPERNAVEVDVGLIKLKPGANKQLVQKALQQYLPKDVLVLTLEEFADREKVYWATSTPTGFIFGFGTVIGFIVGIVIVYQILYSDVSDHLSEYATLKAMGYSDAYLVGVLIQESLILAILGFIPGFLLSSGFYLLAASATLLPIGMTVNRAILVLFLTIVMCTVSGGVAMRKLQAADPADVF